jgi:hypothetical protein
MESPLIVAGLGLDEGELLLRHLLMVRRKYRHLKGKDDKNSPSYFLHALSEKEATMNAIMKGLLRNWRPGPPNPFLDLMGFECIQFDSYDKLYDLNS